MEYIALDNIYSGVRQVLGKLNLEHVHPLVGQIGLDIYVVGGVWHCWWDDCESDSIIEKWNGTSWELVDMTCKGGCNKFANRYAQHAFISRDFCD